MRLEISPNAGGLVLMIGSVAGMQRPSEVAGTGERPSRAADLGRDAFPMFVRECGRDNQVPYNFGPKLIFACHTRSAGRSWRAH